MGSGKFENKHGVGILVNKKWRNHIHWTDHICERAISTSITVNKQHVLMMNVYFLHSGSADHHVGNIYRSIEKHTKTKAKNMKIVGGDFNAELGPGDGIERVSVGPLTRSEGIQNSTAVNTMYRKTPEKQAIYRTPKGTEKQLDYILLDKKHVSCTRDAEANDMIHMGSDHRSVMAQFEITAPKKEVSQKTHIAKKKMKTAGNTKSQDDEKKGSGEANKFEERYAELERKIQHDAEIAAATQKPRMTESSTMSKQAKGVVDAGDTILPHWNEDTNAAASVKMRSGRLVAEVEAAIRMSKSFLMKSFFCIHGWGYPHVSSSLLRYVP